MRIGERVKYDAGDGELHLGRVQSIKDALGFYMVKLDGNDYEESIHGGDIVAIDELTEIVERVERKR